ncbi:hypothetical protein Zm00014a_020677 [Zea mays]|uniref:Uncharacterized protein n=1 Tax=Zea mays TaxID=4577 RepID=A0A3L6FTK2_MAIZE|nr:hypothetical protein Zm00014a_020677 [Zea mays]
MYINSFPILIERQSSCHCASKKSTQKV